MTYHRDISKRTLSLGEFQQKQRPPNLENSSFETFMSEYISFINENKSKITYIVYDCSMERTGNCGGWSDRLVGIMTTFVISILTKKHFLINFDKPCLLHDYVIPANFDWRYNSSLLSNKNHSYHNYLNNNYKKMKKELLGEKDINSYFKADISFLRMNWDFTYNIRKRPNINTDIPWITKYHQADIYKYLYHFLFKWSPSSTRALNNQRKTNRKRNKIACAHVRRGRNPNMPQDAVGPKQPLDVLWKYFDLLDKDEYDLYVASDTDSVKVLARERYPENMIDTPGNITHIDQPHVLNDPDEGFQKQLSDFYTLVNCDILIVPSSGFSILAALVRNIDSGLFCWRGLDLIPCSRYTITEIFPGGKYNPSKPK
ncbi:uncharacterized protein LOC132546360 [Ylistrum balloti]|uniref:uncharacterized protein LOC132546360 n=1 Tax=Ylistrum balloti TaxID=509963 RepID=UPI0029057D92|nr:uncharacterized protein LOC132546360 [Ylistrum balloti]